MSLDNNWVVLELTPKAEGEDPDTIASSIRHHIRDAEVFIPASVVQRDGLREVYYLVDGYAFIRHRHPDAHYSRLEDTKYVQNPLYHAGANRKERKLATVSQQEIETLRSQIASEVDQGIEIGDLVTITSGAYKSITATVCEEILEQQSVVLHIRLRSTDRLVTLPRAFLHLEQKSPYKALRERVDRVGAWVRAASNAAACAPHLLERAEELSRLDAWVERGRAIHLWFRAAYFRGLDVAPLQAKHLRLQALEALSRRRKPEAYMNIDAGVNLVIDGTQLFIRCQEAPGLSGLQDAQGRLTGGVVGFLRSLAAYRKRFPQGSIYICWDGSSRRRKAMFGAYKGNRTARSQEPSFGWAWLREVLPMLGVRQAFNADEEADDVMASLVRGPLSEALNLLVTSDRDLLQAVTEFTHQLCPAIGGGQEKLYDMAAVEQEYCVPPRAMVQLRALSGDTSDHIPGVPGFGLKTAAKVLGPYGTVKTLFQSNLAGLTKLQAKNLRASQRQVVLNVQLMALQDVAFTEIEPNPNQEAARQRIKALAIRPDSILAAFFGVPADTEAVSDVSL